MKRTLKYSALLAAAILAMTGTAYACTNNNDCTGGQVCAVPPWDYTHSLPKICQERQSIFASWGRALVNAVTNIITPIGPITTHIARPAATTATVVAPNATRAYDAMAEIMRRIQEAQIRAAMQAPLSDENGEYTCEPETESVGLDCAAPKEERWMEDARGHKYTVCEEPKKEREGRTGGAICDPIVNGRVCRLIQNTAERADCYANAPICNDTPS